ncbi:MAG: hypothetical protein ACEQSX_15370, partial [Baekduiaceae bacterium]
QLAEALTTGRRRPRTDWRTAEPLDAIDVSPNRLLTSPGSLETLVIDDGASGYLPARIPDVPLPNQDLYWMAEVILPSWQPLPDQRLVQHVLEAPAYSSHAARISREGVAYIAPHILRLGGADLESETIRPRLRPLSLRQAVEALAGQAGLQTRPSDKGLYAHLAAELLGGSEALLERVCDASWDRLVRTLMCPGGDTAIGLHLNDERIYFTMPELASLHAKHQLAQPVAGLLQADIVTRGLLYKCATCRLAAFYTDEEIGDRLRCARCRARFGIRDHGWMPADEPRWHYRLAEVIWQLYEHNGDVPLRAIAEHLRPADDRVSFEYVHEIELWDGEDRLAELDICARRGPDLWIGEAKIAPRLGTKAEAAAKLRGLRRAAEVLQPRGLIFATAAPEWTPGAARQIGEAFQRTAHEVKLVSSPAPAGQD